MKLFSKMKKGFTLVEMIISMALTTILMGAVMLIFSSVTGIIHDMKGDVNINVATDTINMYIFDRMATSTNFNIKLNTLGADGKINPDESKTAIENLLAERDEPAIEDLYAMVIMDGKVYDLGVVKDFADYKTKMNDLNDYRLFNEDFYGKAHYRYTFSVESPSGSTSADRWYRVGVTPYDESGEPMMSERSQMFKLINLQYSKFTPKVDDEFFTTLGGATERIPQDSGIVILYRLKDYTKVTSAPPIEATP